MFTNVIRMYVFSAVILFVGLLFPWASLGAISVDGFDSDDGKLMLIILCFLALGAYVTFRRYIYGVTLGGVSAVLALILAVYEIIHVNSQTIMGMSPDAGVGLYICVAGALLGLYATYVGVRQRQSV